MARGSALVGSFVVHGALVLVGVLAARDQSQGPIGVPPVIAIEAIEAIEVVAPSPLVIQGGAGSRLASLRVAASMISPVPALAPLHRRTAAPRASAPPVQVETTVQIEPASEPSRKAHTDGGAGSTDGAGIAGGQGAGGGRGQGGGLGVGRRIDLPTTVLSLPVPTPDLVPPRSRAQPPQLIYPTRDREVEDSLLFIARLTIDPDGFVVGARLVRGVGGRRDDQAASAVWRFRYSPALDKDGRPVRATIVQHFLVE